MKEGKQRQSNFPIISNIPISKIIISSHLVCGARQKPNVIKILLRNPHLNNFFSKSTLEWEHFRGKIFNFHFLVWFWQKNGKLWSTHFSFLAKQERFFLVLFRKVRGWHGSEPSRQYVTRHLDRATFCLSDFVSQDGGSRRNILRRISWGIFKSSIKCSVTYRQYTQAVPHEFICFG